MIDTQTVTIRQMKWSDRYALVSLSTGMESYPDIDPEWVWVAEREGKIEAMLFTAPAHGAAILLRLNSTGAEGVMLPLLREVLKSLKQRGYGIFISFLSATRPEELKLARLAQRYGALLFPFSGFIAAGKVREDFV